MTMSSAAKESRNATNVIIQTRGGTRGMPNIILFGCSFERQLFLSFGKSRGARNALPMVDSLGAITPCRRRGRTPASSSSGASVHYIIIAVITIVVVVITLTTFSSSSESQGVP